MVITSQGVLEGSANITTTGMGTDLQHNTGNYFSKFKDDLYNSKKKYFEKIIEDSKKASAKNFT